MSIFINDSCASISCRFVRLSLWTVNSHPAIFLHFPTNSLRSWYVKKRGDKIIHLWLRLYKYENTETSHINKKTNYLCFIFRRYGINPNSSKIDQSKIKDAPLFQKEEKDTAAGIRYWAECITHIKESSASTQIKDLFSQLNFYDYRETDTECILTFKTSYNVYNTIETYFIDDFQRVLLKYFPANLKVCYNVK